MVRVTDWFSDEELDRMAQFASSPGYSRSPSMLLPEEDEPDGSDEDVSDEDVSDDPTEDVPDEPTTDY